MLDFVLIPGTDICVLTFVCYVRYAVLTTPAKSAMTVSIFGNPSPSGPSVQPRDFFTFQGGFRQCAELELWANGMKTHSAVANPAWHYKKVISIPHVSAACAAFGPFSFNIVTLRRGGIDFDWVLQHFIQIMPVVHC